MSYSYSIEGNKIKHLNNDLILVILLSPVANFCHQSLRCNQKGLQRLCKFLGAKARRRNYLFWILRVFLGRFFWNLFQYFGIPWNPLESFRILWNSLESYGILWNRLVSFGILWNTLESFGILRNPLESLGILWNP